MIYQNIIIGSGPTGLVAANEILEKGKPVKILDIGEDIEKDNLKYKEDFLEHKDKNLFLKKLKIKKNIKDKYKNEHLKFPFGSDYVFRRNEFEKFKSSKNVDFVLSAAKGGLSNIWGTMVSPFYEGDIKNWDIKYDDFYSNINEIEKIIPILSSKDNLDKFFKIKFGKKHNFNLSSNSSNFFQKLNNDYERLNNEGIFFGRAKLAVGEFYSYKNLECQECGLCHYGCPYDCMFSANNLFDKIKDSKNFEYTNNTYVDKIEKDNNYVKVYTINTITKKKTIYTTKNIFICCGPISTAALILRSNLSKEKTLKFKESQRFFIPVFKKKNLPNSTDQNKNTLSEIFIEVFNKNLCEKSIHIQYYSFLDVMLKPLEKIFGNYTYLLPKVAPFLFGRLNLFIGYLHSDYSNKISITQKNDSDFYLDEIKNEKNTLLIENTIKFLTKNFKQDFFFIKSLLNINLTGASYHYGSSLPMTSNISEKDKTSLLGELSNFANVFILDASILPDMPGSPTTLNVCINAQRIIKELSKEDRI